MVAFRTRKSISHLFKARVMNMWSGLQLGQTLPPSPSSAYESALSFRVTERIYNQFEVVNPTSFSDLNLNPVCFMKFILGGCWIARNV